MFLLLADILNIIVQEIILLANGDRASSAIASFSLFGIIAVLFFGPLVFAHCIHLGLYKRHYVSFISSTIQTTGALFFFYGNNINILINSWGVEIGCGPVCVENIRLTASFSLGVSLIIFNFVPPILIRFLKVLKVKHRLKKEEKTIPNWILALDMVTMFVKIDTLYSAIVGIIQSPEFCSTRDIAFSSIFLAVCLIVGISAELIYYSHALTTNEKSEKTYVALVSLGMVVMVICLPLYLLADNSQPLDCAFGCDTVAANTTINDITCDQVANSSVRLGFTVATFLPLAPIAFIYFMKNRKVLKALKEHQQNAAEMLEDVNEKIVDAIPDPLDILPDAGEGTPKPAHNEDAT